MLLTWSRIQATSASPAMVIAMPSVATTRITPIVTIASRRVLRYFVTARLAIAALIRTSGSVPAAAVWGVWHR